MTITQEQARQEIANLVAKYQSLTAATIKKYTEADTRRVFILPLFQALGWDVYSREEVAEEVKAVSGRVDYVFKLHGVSQFYLEAKALRAELTKPEYVKQAITYAYNKGITWAVLTDFEGLQAYNAQTGRLFINLSHDNYLKDFDDLWLLSRESLESNALNEKAEKYGALPTRLGIEQRLYNQLRQWREDLFTQLYRYNPKLSFNQVDEIIQRLFNRLIFIRTCEDRRIEDRVLLGAVHEWRSGGCKGELIEALRRIFRDFNGYYDSDLFEIHLTDQVFIESTIIEGTINGLYEIPGGMASYDFSLIDADVLGAVYEQYLGHVATVVKQRAKEAQIRMDLGYPVGPTFELTAKKERRKEHGIYYTPRFITNYIVKETVGRFLEESSYNEILNMKILDPACGSGSFLIRAYDELLSYHAYRRSKSVSDLDQYERLPILTRNIFGVDLDMQAVEIARLNLLLRSLAKRETLPSLADKIRQGNSLISGTEGELKGYFGNNWREKKSFNWEQEFSQVFNRDKRAKALTITIDTNAINAKQENENLNLLEQYCQRGLVEIFKTDVLDTELLTDKTNYGEKRRHKASRLPEDIGVCVLDHSRLDHTRLAGEEDAKLQDEIIKVLFQKTRHHLTTRQLRDAMHLHTHVMHQRDIFVTMDKYILGRKEELHKKFGINAGTPEECLQFIDGFLSEGFDVIIGNPPYVRIQTLPRDEADYYREFYQSAFGSFDIYILFLEQAIKLLKPGGRLGFITSGKFLKADYGKRIQQLLHQNCTVESIIDLSAQQVFAEATTYPVIIVLKKGTEDKLLRYTFIPADVDLSKTTQPIDTSTLPTTTANQEAVIKGIWPPIGSDDTLLAKLAQNTVPLGELSERIFQGLVTSADKVYTLEKRSEPSESIIKVYSHSLEQEFKLESALLKPLLSGKDIERYSSPIPNRLLLFPYKVTEGKAELILPQEFVSAYPKCWEYLLQNRETLENREQGKMHHERWYAYVYPKNLALHDRRKMAIPRLVSRLAAIYDPEGNFYLDNVDVGGLILKENDDAQWLYILGLLNSKLLDFYLHRISVPFRGGFYSANRQFLEPLPIHHIDLDNHAEKKMHDDLVALVDKMLELNKRLAPIRNMPCNKRDELLREINHTDSEIDNLVYKLYGLSEEERKVIERRE
jgi:type I restriction-modification system DNA methylase subunit